MTQLEKIRIEIERRIEQFKEERNKISPTPKSVYRFCRISYSAKIAALEGMLNYINSLPTEQPSEKLDEAADCYLDTISPVGFMEGDYDGSQILDAFRAGAQCQKEQFVNKSCQWLKDNLMNFLSITINDREALDVDYSELIYEFKKAMEDEQ